MTEDDGVLVTSADVNGYTLADLRFPARYVQEAFEPDLPYLALVLEGGLAKSFPRHTMELDRSCGVTMPAGATHSARFGEQGARIAIVKPRSGGGAALGCFDRLAELRGRGFGWLAWRLAAELRASDAAAPLATEGFALELLAATSRETRAGRRAGRPPPWLRAAEDLLRVRTGDHTGLSGLAGEVGVHPAHLARVFRAHHGVSVGEYGRRLRLTRAAEEIAGGDAPLATIAARAAPSSCFEKTSIPKVGW